MKQNIRKEIKRVQVVLKHFHSTMDAQGKQGKPIYEQVYLRSAAE